MLREENTAISESRGLETNDDQSQIQTDTASGEPLRGQDVSCQKASAGYGGRRSAGAAGQLGDVVRTLGRDNGDEKIGTDLFF